MRLDDLDPTEHARDLGRGGGGFPLLGFLPLLIGRGGLGCGGVVMIGVVLLLYVAMSGGVGLIGTSGGPGGAGGSAACDTQEELFACRVMTSTEQVWGQIFANNGGRYAPATINFFEGNAQSGCGAASSAAGPFYCPSDQGIYLDTGFFRDLDQRYRAQGDFARAYVIGHEVGHHIQTLDGTAERVRREQQRAGRAEGNVLSVRLELQADCYAGVWAAQSRRLEPGDIEEGMTAASAIGDDRLQGETQGRVEPESFTHGTSEQRMRWLRRGLESGNPAMCDTFSATAL